MDRNNFIEGNDRLTIQVVPKHIYPTILPCWFFNENNLIECFIKNGFRMIDKFEGLGGNFTNKYIKNSKFIGHVFEKI